MSNCNHEDVTCINPYETIRKYFCNLCGEVMMCSCDEEFGRKYYSHQLDIATELDTQKKIPVTIGFQPNICNTCRNKKEESYPLSQARGRTTKIRRYYWREITIETTKRFGRWAEQNGYADYFVAQQENPSIHGAIQRDVVEELQHLHEINPKYEYIDHSDNKIISLYTIEVIDLFVPYSATFSRKVQIIDNGKYFSVEEFVANYFGEKGYNVLFTESRPFHVIFAVFMWLVIQDPQDSHCQVVGFGRRGKFENETKNDLIWTGLPFDFGTKGYYNRRLNEITSHLQSLPKNKQDLLWCFDYWIEPSANLRQYLWAHASKDIDIARNIIGILPSELIIKILNYLIQDYWGRFCGWPDLLIFNDSEFFFVEVKSSKDKLSEDQKTWIKGNSEILQLPFKIAKVRKKPNQKSN
ncbi:VRR-NUC domain-containing protein [Methanolobus sp. WCC1]|uniref:VRR-NUC domain-containing protein n=1 Tax=unclassified Methanolobus TaxID=2629569 RepID=UPI00324D6BCB